MESGLKLTGIIVYWQLCIELLRRTFAAQLAASGIDHTVADPAYSVSFTKAVDKVKTLAKKRGILIRLIKRAKDEIAYGIVLESVNEAQETLAYAHEVTVCLNCTNGVIQYRIPDGASVTLNQVCTEIETLYNKYIERMDTKDVRTALLIILKKMHAVSLRDHGGIYFIPIQHRDEVDNLSNLFTLLGPSCELATIPQVDMEGTKKAIYKAFVTDMKEEMTTFKSELESLSPDSKKYEYALNNKLAEYKALKEKVSYYSDALAMQATDLSAELEALQASVLDRLSKVD